MKPVYAVIGAGYGDCGKGLATDFLTRHFKSQLVVRGNGGAQAGHTVVDGDKRHVFGHIGSGTFANASTYLASNFIVNPIVLKKELRALGIIGASYDVFAHSDCRVSTIYDMAINSLIEVLRGGARHGSCGLGINETVTRHAAGYYLTLGMFKDAPVALNMLHRIYTEWVNARMRDLDVHKLFKNADVETQELAKPYLSALETSPAIVFNNLKQNIDAYLDIDDPKLAIGHEKEIIYEGAQGLMLDEFLGEFPYVTRSVTGLPSAIRAAHECGRTEIQPLYITRCYATRHGAGPLTLDGAKFCDKEVTDKTNVHNDWQGTMRFAPLDLLSLWHFISQDLNRSTHVAALFGVNILKPKIAVTCLDQVGEYVLVKSISGKICRIHVADISREISIATECDIAFESAGPTAQDVTVFDLTPKGVL